MLYAGIVVVFVVLDQIVKYLVRANIELGEVVDFIPHLLGLTYVQNTGAAFSILSGQRIFLILLPAVVVAIIILYIILKKPQNKLLMLSFSLIISGGIGNLIDRIRLGYVIDFLDFRLINFPVFNIADIWVTLGAALFVCLLLFSKEDNIV